MKRRPVLITEIKDDTWVHNAANRQSAGGQIRRRYNGMTSRCPLPRLWGLNLLGTSLRVYCTTIATRVIEPNFEPRPNPSRILPRDFLGDGWDINILSPEGFQKMKEIVTDINAAAAL